MIFQIPRLLSEASKYMTLERNDVLLTGILNNFTCILGTPAGVGPLKVGDKVSASLNYDQLKLNFDCVKAPLHHDK